MAAERFVLFLVVPFLELYAILQAGQAIGALNTIGVLNRHERRRGMAGGGQGPGLGRPGAGADGLT